LRNGGAPAAGALYEAYAWTSLGQRDTALALLGTVTRAQPADRAAVGRLPWFKSLHGDPRFERLLNRP
jgi:hypothetical protein